jgi:hypothetical protein
MLPINTNPISLLITLAAIFGVFAHDTQIDNAFITALSTPAILADINTRPSEVLSNDQHIHSERSSFSGVSFNTNFQPATKPRNEDDRKYIAQKRLMGSTTGHEYSWPSI